MNKTFIAFLVVAIALISLANAMPATIDNVEVEGTSLNPDGDNKLDIENGQEITIKVEVTSQSDLQDVEIKAFISGYEYNDHERISDTTSSFDMEENTTYSKKLKLTLPERVDEDEYKLRIVVTDRNNDDISANYNLKIEPQRHNMEIRDIMTSPENAVQAGYALLTSIRVRNLGQSDEDSVKVSLSVSELGLSQSTYIDEIEAGDTESSEDIYMIIPKCAKPGAYEMLVKVTYDDGYETVSDYVTFAVNGDACEVEAEEEEEEEEEEEVLLPVIPQPMPQAPAADEGNASLRNALEIALVALVVILVILGLIIGFSKLNSDEALN